MRESKVLNKYSLDDVLAVISSQELIIIVPTPHFGDLQWPRRDIISLSFIYSDTLNVNGESF